MRVGIPKEIKVLEYRVGMVPSGVKELVSDGHEVFVESSAGMGIGMTDEDYIKAGAKVLNTPEEIFDTCELIIKVKEPQLQECKMLKAGQVLFTYLHLAADPDQAAALVDSDFIGPGCCTLFSPRHCTGRCPRSTLETASDLCRHLGSGDSALR